IQQARAEIDTKSGKVTVWATEYGDDDEPIGEFDDTPSGFGRVAASTARQVIVQRLRDVEDSQGLGEFRDKQDQVVSGIIQRGNNPHMIQVDLGSVEAVLPPGNRFQGKTIRMEHVCVPMSCQYRAAIKGPLLRCLVPTPGWCENFL